MGFMGDFKGTFKIQGICGLVVKRLFNIYPGTLEIIEANIWDFITVLKYLVKQIPKNTTKNTRVVHILYQHLCKVRNFPGKPYRSTLK